MEGDYVWSEDYKMRTPVHICKYKTLSGEATDRWLWLGCRLNTGYI